MYHVTESDLSVDVCVVLASGGAINIPLLILSVNVTDGTAISEWL